MTEIEKNQREIVLAMLPHVPFDGWSRKALNTGAQDAGFTPETAERLFPEGLVQVVMVFGALEDANMVASMVAAGVADLPVRERVSLGIKLRLQALAPHREAVRHMMSFLSLPGRHVAAVRSGLRTVDAIWYAAGDRSTDFNYYTKRGLLGSVYAATVLYWLNDNSDGCSATWDFLDRRIADVMQIPKLQARVRDAVRRLPSPLKMMRPGLARR